jgi:uncharacterized protein
VANKKIIEAVVKITERCNINCTYCYVFNKGDESYKLHDPYMKPDVIEALADFLVAGAADIGAGQVKIDFHGGEPLMMKKRRFDEMCALFESKIRPHYELGFNLQTNGMLVDEEWIQLFRRYDIGIGVSLDGPEAANDAERVDHFGRGTYKRAKQGLDLLIAARREGLIPGLGILTVANPALDAKEVYDHFVRDMDIDAIDFLLPIDSHESFDAANEGAYGDFLCKLYDIWREGEDSAAHVRIMETIRGFLFGGDAVSSQYWEARNGGNTIITVASNGDIGPDDSLRTLNLGLFSKFNIRKHTLVDFLNSQEIQEIVRAENSLPDECVECAWQSICRGGASNGRLINRYSSSRGFNTPSILCSSLQALYAHAAADTLRSGLGFEKLQANLIQEPSVLKRYDQPCGFARQDVVAAMSSA